MRVLNQGPQIHEWLLFKLMPGKSPDDLMTFVASMEGGGPPSGPPPFALAGGGQAISVGREEYVELDLEAGEYLAICLVPDNNTGAPHAALGMVAPFTVQ